MIKKLVVLAGLCSITAVAVEIKIYENQEQIKHDFIKRSVEMWPSEENEIMDKKYRHVLEEVDVNNDKKNDARIWGFYDLNHPEKSHVYLCASTEKDCSKGGYCYAGYFPGPGIDKGIPDLKCKE